MYEHFTDRARKVMLLAEMEAQRRQADFIGAEHLLTALIKENSGIAAASLKQFGMTLQSTRRELEKLTPLGVGKVPGKLPLSRQYIMIREQAYEEANKLNNKHVGTEHLLLALVRHKDGVAIEIIRNHGITPEDIREDVLLLLGAKAGDPKPRVYATEAALNVLEKLSPAELTETVKQLLESRRSPGRIGEQQISILPTEMQTLVRALHQEMKGAKKIKLSLPEPMPIDQAIGFLEALKRLYNAYGEEEAQCTLNLISFHSKE